MCDWYFLCADKINILGEDIDGVGWCIVMLLIALGLQVLANKIYIEDSQVTRVMLQLDPDKRGSPFDVNSYMFKTLAWTFASTLVWIARIILVMGNNLYIFLVVLLGNLVGVYYTLHNQHADTHSLADDILSMLERRQSGNTKTKAKIERAMDKFAAALRAQNQSNEDPSDLEF